ncbi:MAG: alpha-isopropylmalate synthase regulatory domain-containing protein [Acutalibacteraceae bacterium]|nr:alpha-isopropylmalate synthase regulatory domain-containing protein [Acutalibacteraceae bacterium]
MKIKISDKTLSGKQNFSFKEKIEIARQLEKLGVNAIELPAIDNVKTDTLLIKTVASFVKNGVISVGAGYTAESLKNAVNSLATAVKPRIRVEVPVSTVGMEYTCHMKAPKMLETVTELIKVAKNHFDDVEFCAVDATRAEEDFLKDIIISAVGAGANTVTVSDNNAVMMPDDFGKFVAQIKSYIPENVSLSVSAENKNGLAAANGVSALKNGANGIKTDVTGNEICLETAGNIIKNCGAVNDFESGLKYTEMHRILKQIGWIITNAKSETASVTVRDADESGIMLDKNDSREAVQTAVLQLGYDLTEEDSQKVYEEFLRVAEKKTVGAKELDAVVASVALQVPPTYKLVSYVINSGNVITATAQITVLKDGKEIQGICLGDGPIDAAFLAVEQIVGHHYELDDFQIQSVTEGKQALGSAIVKLRNNGKLYSGNGISTDILGAGIRAYINAVNKIVYEEA